MSKEMNKFTTGNKCIISNSSLYLVLYIKIKNNKGHKKIFTEKKLRN